MTIRLLDETVTVADQEAVILHRMERDLMYNPFGTPPAPSAPSQQNAGARGGGAAGKKPVRRVGGDVEDLHEHAHMGLFAGVCGLMAVLLLRALVRSGYTSGSHVRSQDEESLQTTTERTRKLFERFEQESLAAAMLASQEEVAVAPSVGLRSQVKRKTVSSVPVTDHHYRNPAEQDQTFNASTYEQEMLELAQNQPYFDQDTDAQEEEDRVVRTRYEQGGVDLTSGGLLDKVQYDELLRQSVLMDEDEEEDESNSMVALAKRWKKD
jgi:hypothetical protein